MSKNKKQLKHGSLFSGRGRESKDAYLYGKDAEPAGAEENNHAYPITQRRRKGGDRNV